MSEKHSRRLSTALVWTAFYEQLAWAPVLVILAAGVGDMSVVALAASAYSVANLAGNIGFGLLADQVGRRRVSGAGLIGMAATSLLHLAATTPALLVGARFAHGLAAAAVAPAALAMVNDRAPSQRRGEVMARVGLVIAMASMVSPPITGRLAAMLRVQVAIRILAAGLLAVGLWAVAAGRFAEAGAPEVRSVEAEPSAVRRVDPARSVLAAMVAFALMFGQNVLFYAFALRTRQMGTGPATTGALLSAFAVGSVIAFVPPLSRAVDRWGWRNPLLAGLGGTAAGLFGLVASLSVPGLAMSLFVYGLGFGLVFTGTSTLSGDSAGRYRGGLAFGFLTAAFSAGSIVGPLVTRPLQAVVSPFTVAGALALVSGAVALAWPRLSASVVQRAEEGVHL